MFDLGLARACAPVIAVLVLAVPASAQQQESGPLEVLVGVGGVGSIADNGGDVRLSVSLPRNDRFSWEPFAALYRGNPNVDTQKTYAGGRVYDTRATFGFQFKQRILGRSRPGHELFVTYGAMGLVGRELECTSTLMLPSWIASARTSTTCHPSGATRLEPALLGLLGFGGQYAMTSRLSLRLEAQGGFVAFVPIGVRVAATAVIPLGPLSSNASRSR